jgi:thiol-disulfide isomerase/thioredoxin
MRGRSLLVPGGLVLLAAVSAAAGCPVRVEHETTIPFPPATTTEAAVPAPEPVNESVTLRAVDRAAYDAILAEHRGKVIVVDYWATWCPPCQEQFPHTVELSRKYPQERLAVVSMSFDDDVDADAALAFLRRMDARIVNLRSKYGAGTESIEKFEIDNGAVPHYKIFDRDGRLAATFNTDPAAENPFTPEDIEAKVKELLGAVP